MLFFVRTVFFWYHFHSSIWSGVLLRKIDSKYIFFLKLNERNHLLICSYRLSFIFSLHFPSSSFSVFHYINAGKLISTVISFPVSDPFSVIGVFRWIMSSHSLECIFLKELGPGLKCITTERNTVCFYMEAGGSKPPDVTQGINSRKILPFCQE